ncbi:hypothetical protein H310_04081 [Aphanomyces invadans]|nr:hypothetical protein H310_04081 [Aphanomyces invadans]ETW05033.1 hypothetical protein H310_04081 [Aphanomyces invadans]|eukprot:XP_008866471.1 hypothetical protein H310_04081 [Aphanomyces invadans]
MGRESTTEDPPVTKILQQDASSEGQPKAGDTTHAEETKPSPKTQAMKIAEKATVMAADTTSVRNPMHSLAFRVEETTANEDRLRHSDDLLVERKKLPVIAKPLAVVSFDSSTRVASEVSNGISETIAKSTACKATIAVAIARSTSINVSTASKKPPSASSKLDAARMKTLVSFRMRATAAFVRFLRTSGLDLGNVQALLSQFYQVHPEFKSSKLNEDRLQRYSKGLITVSAKVLTVHPLDNVPTGTYCVRDVKDADFSFTFVFWLRFCAFFVSNYSKLECSFTTATKAFGAQFGIEWQGSPVMKSMLAFYCCRVLHIDGPTPTQIMLRLRRDASHELKRLVSMLFLVWLFKHFPNENSLPWVDTCNRFRRKYHLQRQKMSHFDLFGFPWMRHHNIVMDKSEAVWRIQCSTPQQRLTLLHLYSKHMKLTEDTQVPLLEDMSMLFAHALLEDSPTCIPSMPVVQRMVPSQRSGEDDAMPNQPLAPRQPPKKRANSEANHVDGNVKRPKLDPLDTKSELFQRHSYLTLVDHVHEI